jgi:hypothetical protein
LLITAREVRETAAPSIVAGDLNDVAWSRTTRLFQDTGGLLDPRIGRGPYPTYNANWPLLRWPLDHVLFEREFGLIDFRALGDIGSDHFPIYAALCQAPAGNGRREPPPREPEDVEAARERSTQEGREEARERLLKCIEAFGHGPGRSPSDRGPGGESRAPRAHRGQSRSCSSGECGAG